jgi:hypothetical protein
MTISEDHMHPLDTIKLLTFILSATILAFTCKMLPSVQSPDAHTGLVNTLWSLQEIHSLPAFFFLQDFLHLLICSTISPFFAVVEFNVDGDNLRHLAMSNHFSVGFFSTSAMSFDLLWIILTYFVGHDTVSCDVEAIGTKYWKNT